jgi:hypothetical protein
MLLAATGRTSGRESAINPSSTRPCRFFSDLVGSIILVAGGISGSNVVGAYTDATGYHGFLYVVPEEGKGPVAGAPIKEGRYQINKDLGVGSYRVEIQGSRKVPGKLVPDPMNPGRLINAVEPVVPPKVITRTKG